MAGLTFETPRYLRAVPPLSDDEEDEEITLRARGFTRLLALSMADGDEALEVINPRDSDPVFGDEITEKTFAPPEHVESARWLAAGDLQSEPRTVTEPPPPLPGTRRPAFACSDIPPALTSMPVMALTPDEGVRAIKKRVWFQAALTSAVLLAAVLLVLGISSSSPARADTGRAPAAYVSTPTWSCIDDLPSRSRTPQKVSTPLLARPTLAARASFAPSRAIPHPKVKGKRGNIIRVAPF
jgi:hypothetical protein